MTLPGGQTITYVYNAAGDRTEVINNGTPTSYASNADNEITQVGSTTYTYDANGNLHTVTDASGTTTYTYNDLNQLVSITAPDGTRHDLPVQPAGLPGRRTTRRTARRRITWSIRPAWATWWLPTTAAARLIAHYNYGLGLVSQTGPSGTGYYDFDASGNTVGITGASGDLRQPVQLPAVRRDDHRRRAAEPVHLRRAGRRDADRRNLFSMRARNYTPATGQFSATIRRVCSGD